MSVFYKSTPVACFNVAGARCVFPVICSTARENSLLDFRARCVLLVNHIFCRNNGPIVMLDPLKVEMAVFAAEIVPSKNQISN